MPQTCTNPYQQVKGPNLNKLIDFLNKKWFLKCLDSSKIMIEIQVPACAIKFPLGIIQRFLNQSLSSFITNRINQYSFQYRWNDLDNELPVESSVWSISIIWGRIRRHIFNETQMFHSLSLSQKSHAAIK